MNEITLPTTLTTLGKSCFHNSGIREIVIPERVSTIESQAFYNCKELTKVVFQNTGGLETICMYAFAFTQITEIVVPASVRTIEQGAFCDCKELRCVRINEGLESIGKNQYDEYNNKYYGAFENAGVEEVELPSTLKRLEYSAFQNCQRLSTVRLPEGLESIGDGCFKESGIEEVTFGRCLNTVGKNAFASCHNLKLAFVESGCTLNARDYLDLSVTISQMPQIPIRDLRSCADVKIPDNITGIGH